MGRDWGWGAGGGVLSLLSMTTPRHLVELTVLMKTLFAVSVGIFGQ